MRVVWVVNKMPKEKVELRENRDDVGDRCLFRVRKKSMGMCWLMGGCEWLGGLAESL